MRTSRTRASRPGKVFVEQGMNIILDFGPDLTDRRLVMQQGEYLPQGRKVRSGVSCKELPELPAAFPRPRVDENTRGINPTTVPIPSRPAKPISGLKCQPSELPRGGHVIDLTVGPASCQEVGHCAMLVSQGADQGE